MRILLGLVTLAFCSAALVVWLDPDGTGGELAVVTAVTAGGEARLAVPAPERATRSEAGADNGGPRFFGFALPSTATAADPQPDKTANAAPASGALAVGERSASAGWASEIVIYPDGRDNAVVVPVAAGSQVMSPRDRPRHELVQELQRELRRVGCYSGEIDGAWGAGSKRSMRAFMDHVNSRLQSDDPDLIQLTLVRGYPGTACRTPSAPGQMHAGRAPVPAPAPVMLRDAALPVYTATTGRPAQSTTVEQLAPSAVRPPVLEGRMAVGGPVPPATAATDAASLNAAPAVAAPRQAQRPRPRGAAQRQRVDRSWTRNFFDQ